ncbi:VolA/Pla-1 family phospholipase [Photobacterium lucens]|uniref:VolA/Pla-1 family phospholipase n=1 Tax=Photobacterium lucens TaxID=2562949 RepID=UPI00136A116E|nr:VolA/Pla-1 family phospholipase [Photobacterium lucens]MBP2699957.1 lipase [Vibrio parahaemolyticus]MZG56476.1 lipase [Photobacterium lucens]MZG79146.1 lipase [Photobacterium lucens]
MKFNSIALVIASALSVIGCGGGSQTTIKPTVDPDIANSLKAETKVDFDLLSANKKIVFPSYLGMDVQDGTLATREGATTPEIAMGQTDGWSTTQPITINFTGKALDPTTAANSFYLIKSGDPTNPDDTTQPTLLSQQNGDFKVTVSGNSLIVMLLKPLDPSSNYMFAVTDDLKDMNGEAVGMSNSYALLKADSTPPAAALVPAQKITHATEAEFEQAGVNRDNIIFSTWFTTLSSGDVLFAAKMATEEAMQLGAKNVWQGSAIASNVTDEQLDKLFTFSEPTKIADTTVPNKASKISIYQGTLSLPYYLDIRANKFMNTPWQSGMPSLAKIKYVLTHGSDADKSAVLGQLSDFGVTPEDMAEVATNPQIQIEVLTKLMGKKITLANGKQLDPERIITRYSAVPELKSVQTINYTLVLPNNPKCQSLGANNVTIFQHGVTADKSVLTAHSKDLHSLAESLIGDQCRAIFAINQPLHGEDRGIHITDANGNTQYENASTDPSMYLNLENLTVARDNLRQSTIDVINLRASIGKLFAGIKQKQNDGTNPKDVSPLDMLNPNNGVSFAGHSLGAIVGTNVGNIANRPTMNPAFDQQYFAINKLSLANPGAEIPYLLMNSDSFGGLIKAGVLQGTIASPTEITPYVIETGKFLQILQTCYEAQDSQHKDLSKCYVDNIEGYEKQHPELKAQWTQNFIKFAYAAQTVMDPVDPINMAHGIPQSLPVFVQMVKGDSTIPNITMAAQLPYSPFTGTEPLIKQLGLSKQGGDKAWKEYQNGTHTSLLDATASNATTKTMQSDMANFLNS